MKTVQVRNDFPPGFFAAIGYLAVSFGRVEYEIKLSFKTLFRKGFATGMAEAERCRTFYKLCERTKTLANKELSTPYRETFIGLIDTALTLARQRNS